MDKREDVTYRLTSKKTPLCYLLKAGVSGDLVFFDEKTGKPRAIRHCPNEQSIFLKDQTEFAKVEPLPFEDGFFVAKANQVITQEFLGKHPDNGRIFEKIDVGHEAEMEIEIDELVTDLKSIVKEKAKEEDGVYELQALAASLIGSVAKTQDMTTSELKREIYMHIDRNPKRFLNQKGAIELFDAEVKRKHLILLALQAEYIMVSPNKKSIVWGDSGNIVTNIPNGIKPIDHLCDFLTTDEGYLVAERIVNLSSGNDDVAEPELASVGESDYMPKKKGGRPSSK